MEIKLLKFKRWGDHRFLLFVKIGFCEELGIWNKIKFLTVWQKCHIIFNMNNKETKKFQVIFYRTDTKLCPLINWLNSLNTKLRAKTLMMISLLEKNGYNLREPYSKAVSDGIFELRTITGNNITRCMYFFCIGNKIVITNGFVKKTQKTPKSEIELAKKYKEDYLKRNRGK